MFSLRKASFIGVSVDFGWGNLITSTSLVHGAMSNPTICNRLRHFLDYDTKSITQIGSGMYRVWGGEAGRWWDGGGRVVEEKFYQLTEDVAVSCTNTNQQNDKVSEKYPEIRRACENS